jgi:hypothetical protein
MENKISTNNLNAVSTENLIVLGTHGVITALFKNPKTAEKIYDALLTRGYKQADIDLVMSEDTRNTYFSKNDSTASVKDLGNKSLEGTGVGAVVGGTVGAIAAAVAAIGTSLVIPGLGVVIAGSLAASFAGAGAGAAAGSLVGALVGLGIPDDQAQILESGIKAGGVVIRCKAKSDDERNELHKVWLKT